MRTLALVLGLSFLTTPCVALACTPSTGGARSFDTRLSPQAGILCLYILTEYEGATCEAGHEIAHETQDCSRTRRLALTDQGVFVSIAAPRTSRRAWTIVRLFTLGEGARHAELSLEAIDGTAPLRGVVRVGFDRDAIVFRDATSEVRVALAELATRLG